MSDRTKIYLWCFLIAISLRLLLIYRTAVKDSDIDLVIYRAAGQLVANGVNPYNFNDNVDLRQQLRTSKDNFNGWVCSDQGKWNYYANSNLPMASLFFGCIEYCFASPRAFRYSFAFFDSILAVLILAFVIKKWQYRLPKNRIFNKLPPILQHNFPLLIGLSLGALSPILFLWGTYMPEPKGTGLLLILSSIYFSDSANKKLSLFVSPVLLGFSVAFIGLGVFISPLCLYNIYKNNVNGYKKIILYCLISFLACAICLAPFMPELYKMMLSRMTLAVHTIPEHGSMWSELFKILPKSWLLIKNIFIVLFVSINIIGFLRNRLNITILSANLIYLFTNIYLMNGSMDRMNIALVTLIILLGYSQVFRFTTLLWFVYLIYGTFSFTYFYFLGRGIRQEFDGVFVFSFTVLYFAFLIVQTFANKSSSYETVSSNTRS
jgi:hypothetical protein